MNTRRILLAVLFISVFAVVAKADIVPWANKWFQPPEMQEPWGYDIASNVDYNGNNEPNQVVMDDWMCNDSLSPVVGFRWWGSYFMDAQDVTYDLGAVEGFYISIHKDIPAGAMPSHPGDLIEEWYFAVDQLGCYGGGLHELFVGTDVYGDAVYEYFILFDTPFIQTEGTVYWVNIVAEIGEGIDENVWGWHTSGRGDTHNIDDAVVIGDYNPVTGEYEDWYPLEWQGESVDMAFEVIPEPASILLLVPGLGAIGWAVRRRRR